MTLVQLSLLPKARRHTRRLLLDLGQAAGLELDPDPGLGPRDAESGLNAVPAARPRQPAYHGHIQATLRSMLKHNGDDGMDTVTAVAATLNPKASASRPAARSGFGYMAAGSGFAFVELHPDVKAARPATMPRRRSPGSPSAPHPTATLDTSDAGIEVGGALCSDEEVLADCCPAALDGALAGEGVYGVGSSSSNGGIGSGSTSDGGSSVDVHDRVQQIGRRPSPPSRPCTASRLSASTEIAGSTSTAPVPAAAPAPATAPTLAAASSVRHMRPVNETLSSSRQLLASAASSPPQALSGAVMDAQLLYLAGALPDALVQLMPGGVGSGVCVYVTAANSSAAGQASTGSSQMVRLLGFE